MSIPHFKATFLSCTCGHEWSDHLPYNCVFSIWSAAIKALHCPKCGGGSRKILFGQQPKETAVESGKPLTQRLAEWHAGSDTGSSSKSIAAKMSGVSPDRYGWAYPHDPDDLGRCLRLLRLIPEWQPRISEMAECGHMWRRLVPHWEELSRSMEGECGLFWEKAKAAPKTYAMMRKILEAKSDAINV